MNQKHPQLSLKVSESASIRNHPWWGQAVPLDISTHVLYLGGMTRLFLDQYITVKVNDVGKPLSFVWHGEKYTVERVIQRWEVDTGWWETSGRIWRAYFALITVNQMLCVIYHDLELNEWRMNRLYD